MRKKVVCLAVACAAVFLITCYVVGRFALRVVGGTASPPDSAECQAAYAKAKACIDADFEARLVRP